MSRYLTKLGREGRGRDVNEKPVDAIRFVHDILERAAEERLDVYMLCGCLRSALRDEVYANATNGVTFAQSLRGVLEVGRNVKILVWDEARAGLISKQLLSLMTEARGQSGWGSLDIRLSGTSEGGDDLTHFIVATDPEKDRWLLRVEKPHPPLHDLSKEEIERVQVPAAIYFTDAEAKAPGQKLLEMFERLFQAVRADHLQAETLVLPAGGQDAAGKEAVVPGAGAFK